MRNDDFFRISLFKNYTEKTMDPIKLNLIYSKTGLIRFTSHRDLMRMFFRVFSKIELPLRYSEGYSPHPRVTFCPPLKVGMEGMNELMEVHLTGLVETERIIENLNAALPAGMKIEGASLAGEDSPALGKLISEVEYSVSFSELLPVTDQIVDGFMAADEVEIERVRKDKIKVVNIRRGVERLKLLNSSGDRAKLIMVLLLEKNNRPYDVLSALSGWGSKGVAGLKWIREGFYGPDYEGRKRLLNNQIPIIY